MATNSIASGLAAILLPKGKPKAGGIAFSPTFNPSQDLMAAPQYQDHLTDLYSSRASSDSRALIALMANQDPDVSAAINAYLTVCGSVDPVVTAYNQQDVIDPDGIAQAQQLLALVTTTNDYTIGYSSKPTLDTLNNNMRYMIMLRGMVAAELVLDKTYLPSELRLIDPISLEWHQKTNGVYYPLQKPTTASGQIINLDIPTFFTNTYHQSPLNTYTYSPFVAAINTITSRTLVINELYRIMKIVGYPRVDIQVVEEVLTKSAPPALRTDPTKLRAHVNTELNNIRNAISSLGTADAFVHSDAVKASIINDKNPGAGMQIQGVIDVLNAQNQASLKVMPAVVGKANNGQVASVEARLFAMNCDAVNRVVAGIYTNALSLALRLAGYAGRVEVTFPNIEMRPVLELEPQKTMKSSRLKQDLSLGIISDEEYCMEMYGRPPLPGAEPLSGTNFLEQQVAAVNTDGISVQDDPLGQSLAPQGGTKAGKSNAAAAGGGGQKAKTTPAAPAKPATKPTG